MTDFEELRQLVAFQRFGTLSAAADELHITQPTMTRAMRRLEREVGVPLFDRSAKTGSPSRQPANLPPKKPRNCSKHMRYF